MTSGLKKIARDHTHTTPWGAVSGGLIWVVAGVGMYQNWWSVAEYLIAMGALRVVVGAFLGAVRELD